VAVDLLQIVLRVIHIAAGIMWVGIAVFVLAFLQPAVSAVGPQGGAVMTHLDQKRKLPIFIAFSAVLTILSGIALYWRDSSGFDLEWITSAVGVGFTIGAVAAILAFAIGFVLVKPRVDRLAALGGAMGGGSPAPDQLQEMRAIQQRLQTLGVLTVVLLTVAVVAMASARFL
jgi:uncharacterized membrane protein